LERGRQLGPTNLPQVHRLGFDVGPRAEVESSKAYAQQFTTIFSADVVPSLRGDPVHKRFEEIGQRCEMSSFWEFIFGPGPFETNRQDLDDPALVHCDLAARRFVVCSVGQAGKHVHETVRLTGELGTSQGVAEQCLRHLLPFVLPLNAGPSKTRARQFLRGMVASRVTNRAWVSQENGDIRVSMNSGNLRAGTLCSAHR